MTAPHQGKAIEESETIYGFLPSSLPADPPTPEARPSIDQLLMAAWQYQSPSYDKAQLGLLFPRGFWPDIARRVLQWERQGVSLEELDIIVEQARTDYRTYWTREQARYDASGHKPAPTSSADARRQKLGAEILKGFEI